MKMRRLARENYLWNSRPSPEFEPLSAADDYRLRGATHSAEDTHGRCDRGLFGRAQGAADEIEQRSLRLVPDVIANIGP